MVRHLIDSNAVTYYCTDTLPDKAWAFMDAAVNAGSYISVITQIETLSWKTPNPATEHNVKYFVAISEIIELTPDIAVKTVELRRATRLKIPDAIVAATAIVHGLTLITSDADFLGIPGLKTIDPLAMA